MKLALVGSEKRELYGDFGPVSVRRRIGVAVMGTQGSMYGPTPNLQHSAEIGERRLTEIRTRLDRLVDIDLRALERDLDAAGAPWTPGR